MIDLLSSGSPQPGAPERKDSVRRGVIIDTPASPAELVRVIFPGFGDQAWGPLHWTPRVDSAGRVVYPERGLQCVVLMERGEQPVCIVSWGDGTEQGAGSGSAELAVLRAGLGPVVTSLPAPADRYPGMIIRYRHQLNWNPWLCIWDLGLNGGAGAWAVYGPTPIGVQQSGSTGVVGNAAQAMTNGPTITTPMTGYYYLEASGSIAMANAPGGIVDWSVAFARQNVGIVDCGRGTLPNAAWQGRQTVSRRPKDAYLFTAGQVASLRVQASAAAADMRYGDYTPWQLAMYPAEIRA